LESAFWKNADHGRDAENLQEAQKMISKQELGINGEHSALGRNLDMAEFKGFTISELNNIKGILKEMKEDYLRETKEFRDSCQVHRVDIGKRIKAGEDKINGLEAFKNRILGMAAIAGITAGLIANWIAEFFKGGI